MSGNRGFPLIGRLAFANVPAHFPFKDRISERKLLITWGSIQACWLDGLAKPGLAATHLQVLGLRATIHAVACATGRTTISSMSTCGGRVTANTTQSAMSSAESGFNPS